RFFRWLVYIAGLFAWNCGESEGVHDYIPPPIPEPEMETTVVVEIEYQSFMSMVRLENGDILVGTYCFPEETAYLYKIGNVLPIASVDVGEAIFRITEDKGNIILACEHRGEIYVTGLDVYDFYLYETLKAGRHKGAFDAKRLLGELVMVGGGEIYTDGYGTTENFGNDYYVKFAFQVNETALVAGYSYINQCAGWFHSENCIDWIWENIGPKYSRFMAAAVSIDPQYIYLVGTNNYKDGHNHDAATLWVYDTLIGTLTQLWCFEGFDYASCIQETEDGRIFFGLTKGWRSQSPGATLVEWDGQKPQLIEEFDEAEIREIVFKDEKIYCATRLDKVRGRVYEISGVL
ncbi:hypothetical protein LCGC14_2088300, partial [marine sediment metagenome]